MFRSEPFLVGWQNTRQLVRQTSWLVMAPGLMLTLLALAILIWPELLAYLVASAMLVAGILLLAWGWGMRQAERQRPDNGERIVYYKVL
jgi:hypothetical protein